MNWDYKLTLGSSKELFYEGITIHSTTIVSRPTTHGLMLRSETLTRDPQSNPEKPHLHVEDIQSQYFILLIITFFILFFLSFETIEVN
jgi:hypothetical protein